MKPLIQIMVPVYNEGETVLKLYHNILNEGIEYDKLFFVYDMDSDTSLPFIKLLIEKDSKVSSFKNNIGKGVVNAMRAGFSEARPGPFIVLMADCSDKLSVIPEMIELWIRGSKVVSPSRYMVGGKQHGGPKFKKLLSGFSGRFLSLLGFPTSDPTNNFKLYDGEWLRNQIIESDGGFEVALELTGKAFKNSLKISQIPTEWWDRTDGKSNFKLWKWLPKYLRWYIPLIFLTPYRKLSCLRNVD